MPANNPMTKRADKLPTSAVIGIAAAAVIIVLILTLVAGSSLYSRLRLNAKVISKKQQAENQLSDNLNSLPALAQAYQNLGSTQKLISDALPTTADFPSLIATMEAIAATSNVQLAGVNPSASNISTTTGISTPVTSSNSAAASSAPVQFPYSVTISGNYNNIIGFLSKLQLSNRPIQITSIRMNGTTGVLTADLGLITYYYNPAVLTAKDEVVK